MPQRPLTTTNFGSPAPSDDSSLTVGAGGPVLMYNKDGPMRYHHSGNQPVYAPNSYGGPRADPKRYREPSWLLEGAEIMRTAYLAHKEDNDFIQPGMLYRNVMSPTEQEHLVGNIVWQLSHGVERFIQERRGEKLPVPDRSRPWSSGSQRPRFKSHGLANELLSASLDNSRS